MDQVAEKLKAEFENQKQAAGSKVGRASNVLVWWTDESKPQSMADEKENSANYHLDQAKRAQLAVDFLRAHPEFEQFITLIRSGSIQI